MNLIDSAAPGFNLINGFITSEKSSRLMRAIKKKNTIPEVSLRKILWRAGIRFTLHSDLIGKPDIVIKAYKVAILVDGDFWHGFDWRKKKASLKKNRNFDSQN